MSKIQLKKELSRLDREQLIGIILDNYSLRKDAKAYFDFFINPDIDKLTEKYSLLIEKEMLRGKYTKSTARLSRVRTHIREYASFGVPPESVQELMIYTLKLGLDVERRKYVSQTFTSGIIRLATDILTYGDKNSIFDSTMRLMEDALSGNYGYKGFVNQIRYELHWSLI